MSGIVSSRPDLFTVQHERFVTLQEIFIIIAVGAAVFFAVRYLQLRRSVEDLAGSLSKGSVDAPLEIPNPPGMRAVHTLQRAVLNTVAEAALIRDSERRQREFQEALLNEIKDAIFILDRNREIRFLNKAATILFPSDQPYKARAFIDVCRDHRVYDTLELAEEVGAKVSDNIMLRITDSQTGRLKEITLLVEAEPLSFGLSNQNTGAWILMKDISRQLETEQIRQDFVANASHELRTPLSIINGYLETMDDSDVDLGQATYRRAIRTMRKHGERIARIVEDMLTISKLESATDLLNLEPFDLRDSVDEMIGQLMPIIEQNQARVHVNADPGVAWILAGDRFYWDQIFFNLIENALKQNSSPGLTVTISFHEENGRYLISVADNGIGIPAADIPLVFKRFYRVQKHHAQTQIKGTGLGLSIVKRAVEAHHGRIEVDSQPGVMTVFTVSVPKTSISIPDSTTQDRPPN